MAKILPTPSRGQPIDASFLFELTNTVNDIIKAIDQRKGKTYIKPSLSNGVISQKSTANSSFFASTFQVSPPSEKVGVDTTVSVDVSFSGLAFDGPPVVTATPIISGEVTDASKSAVVTISDITKAGCKAHILFAKDGTVKNLYIHVIAIGTIA